MQTMEQTKKKPRPEPVKSSRLDIRASEADMARWHKTAEIGGRTLSQLVRWLLDREASETDPKPKRR